MIDTVQTSLPDPKVKALQEWIAHPGYQVAAEIAEHQIAYHQAKAANAALESAKDESPKDGDMTAPPEFQYEMAEARLWLTFRDRLSKIATDEELLRVLTLNPSIHRD